MKLIALSKITHDFLPSVNKNIKPQEDYNNIKRYAQLYTPRELKPKLLDALNKSLNDSELLSYYHKDFYGINVFENYENAQSIVNRTATTPGLLAKLLHLETVPHGTLPNNKKSLNVIMDALSEKEKNNCINVVINNYRTPYAERKKEALNSIIKDHMNEKQLKQCLFNDDFCVSNQIPLLEKYIEMKFMPGISKIFQKGADEPSFQRANLLKKFYPKKMVDELSNIKVPDFRFQHIKSKEVKDLNETLKYLSSCGEVSADEILPVYNKFIHFLDDENVKLYSSLHGRKTVGIKQLDPQAEVLKMQEKTRQEGAKKNFYKNMDIEGLVYRSKAQDTLRFEQAQYADFRRGAEDIRYCP